MTASPRITSRADVVTDSADRYAKQLVSHLGRKVAFTQEGATATASLGTATGSVVAGGDVLTLLASGDDEESVARVEHVLSSHLERFGARDELTVTWVRGADAGAAARDAVPRDDAVSP